MGLFGFLKPIKPVGFTYRPRFYDEKKEEFQERIKRAQGLADNDPEMMKNRISRSLRRNSHYVSGGKLRQQETKRSNMRLLVIIIFLILLAYAAIEIYLPRIAHLF